MNFWPLKRISRLTSSGFAASLLLAILLFGCETPRAGSEAETAPGQVTIQLRWDKPEQYRLEKAASVFVDGKLAGTCWAPGEVQVSLPPGEHRIAIDLSWVWDTTTGRRSRAVTMAGEQRVTVMGKGRSQTVLFERNKLTVVPIED